MTRPQSKLKYLKTSLKAKRELGHVAADVLALFHYMSGSKLTGVKDKKGLQHYHKTQSDIGIDIERGRNSVGRAVKKIEEMHPGLLKKEKLLLTKNNGNHTYCYKLDIPLYRTIFLECTIGVQTECTIGVQTSNEYTNKHLSNNTDEIFINDAGSMSLFEGVITKLKESYGEGTFRNWFSQLYFQGIAGNVIKLSVPSRYIMEWIEYNYNAVILEIAQALNQTIDSVKIVVVSTRRGY